MRVAESTVVARCITTLSAWIAASNTFLTGTKSQTPLSASMTRGVSQAAGTRSFSAQRQADRHSASASARAGTEVALLFGQGDFFCHMKLVKYPAEYERSQIAGDDQDMLAVLQIRRDFARDLLMARRHHVDCNELRARNSLFDVGCGGFYPSNRMDLPAQQDTAVGFDLFKTSGEPFAVAERDAKALISIDRRSGRGRWPRRRSL